MYVDNCCIINYYDDYTFKLVNVTRLNHFDIMLFDSYTVPNYRLIFNLSYQVVVWSHQHFLMFTDFIRQPVNKKINRITTACILYMTELLMENLNKGIKYVHIYLLVNNWPLEAHEKGCGVKNK